MTDMIPGLERDFPKEEESIIAVPEQILRKMMVLTEQALNPLVTYSKRKTEEDYTREAYEDAQESMRELRNFLGTLLNMGFTESSQEEA